MSALSDMVHKLDTRRPGTKGYVTKVPEVEAILAETSRLVSAGIILDEDQPRADEVSVTITVSLTLERRLL